MTELDTLPPPQPNGFGYKFGAKMHQHLATTFLSIMLFASIPWILIITPISMIFGAIRVIFGPKPTGKSAEIDESTAKSKPIREEDSGISENSEASDDENVQIVPKFDYETISPKLKSLNFSDSLCGLLSDYLAQCQKVAVLVTLRDVTTLTDEVSTMENTVRIQYKKRKLKVMSIGSQATILEILRNFYEKHSDGSPVLIYFIAADDFENVEKLAENRKFHLEIKEIMAENGEKMEDLERSEMEFLMIRKESILWNNASF